MDDEDLAAWSALVAVYQAVLHDVVRALDAEAGIDSGVFSALAHLRRAEPHDEMAMSELQRLMHPRYSQPGFSRLVQRMERNGLVERRAHAADKRAATVRMTRAGGGCFDRANAVYVRAVEEHFLQFVTPEERQHLAVELHGVIRRRTRSSD